MQLFPAESSVEFPSLPKRDDHPVPRQGIVQPSEPPAISTNKFYANLMLGNRNQAAWLHPFSVWCTQAEDTSPTWGLNVAHIEAEQRASRLFLSYDDMELKMLRSLDQILTRILSNITSTQLVSNPFGSPP
jgi:endoglucanase Acf2